MWFQHRIETADQHGYVRFRARVEDVDYAAPAAGFHHVFTGRVPGESMEGAVEFAGGKGAVRRTVQGVKA